VEGCGRDFISESRLEELIYWIRCMMPPSTLILQSFCPELTESCLQISYLQVNLLYRSGPIRKVKTATTTTYL